MMFDFSLVNTISSSPSVVRMPTSGIDTRIDAYPNDVSFLEPLKKIQAWDGGDVKPLKTIARFVKCGPFGSNLLAKGYGEQGVCVIRPFNIQNLCLSINDLAFISEDECTTNNLHLYSAGCLVFARVGNIAVGRIPIRDYKYTISPNIIIAELKNNHNPDFICAFLSSKYGYCQLQRALKIVAQPTISTDTVKNVLVPLPDSKIQEYLGRKVELAEKCRFESETLWSGLNKEIEHFFRETPSLDTRSNFNQVDSDKLTPNRMDAWFYQKKFMELDEHINSSRDFVQITSIAELVPASKRARKPSGLEGVNYVEISSIDIISSVINPSILENDNLPASAKKTLKAGNLIASTVRVNRKCIAVVPSHLNNSLGSTALAIFETSSIEDSYYLEAILKHNVSTAQIMRWNTGSVYPTITEDVFDRILIPNVDSITRKKLGRMGKQRSELLYKSISLIAEAKSEVEALIEGKLDTGAILSGKLKAPTWEDIEKELEGI